MSQSAPQARFFGSFWPILVKPGNYPFVKHCQLGSEASGRKDGVVQIGADVFLSSPCFVPISDPVERQLKFNCNGCGGTARDKDGATLWDAASEHLMGWARVDHVPPISDHMYMYMSVVRVASGSCTGTPPRICRGLEHFNPRTLPMATCSDTSNTFPRCVRLLLMLMNTLHCHQHISRAGAAAVTLSGGFRGFWEVLKLRETSFPKSVTAPYEAGFCLQTFLHALEGV